MDGCDKRTRPDRGVCSNYQRGRRATTDVVAHPCGSGAGPGAGGVKLRHVCDGGLSGPGVTGQGHICCTGELTRPAGKQIRHVQGMGKWTRLSSATGGSFGHGRPDKVAGCDRWRVRGADELTRPRHTLGAQTRLVCAPGERRRPRGERREVWAPDEQWRLNPGARCIILDTCRLSARL